jgi:hypothetical protein
MANPWDADPIIETGQAQKPVINATPWENDPIVSEAPTKKTKTPSENPWENDPIISPSQAPIEESSWARRWLADPTISTAQGIIGLEEGLVGIANIPTLGRAGKGQDYITEKLFGGTTKDLKDYLQTFKTPEQIAQEQEVSEAKGAKATMKALLSNPAALSDVVLQSLPSMVGAAGAASYAVKKGIPFIAGQGANYIRAAAVSEAAITTGAISESIRQQTEDGLLTPEQAVVATGSGILTGIIGGVVGPKAAKLLGVEDFDVLLAKALGKGTTETTEKAQSKLVYAISVGIGESAFEELPQSMQEQIAQNIALGKDPMDGVAEAGATGFMAALIPAAGMGYYQTYKKNKTIANNKQTELQENEDDDAEDGEAITEESREQIKNNEFNALVEEINNEKQAIAPLTDEETKIKTFETKLTPEVLKNIGLKPNSKAFKQLRDKNLSDPKVKETFIKLLEDSSATINETITSSLLEEASLRQQAYEALNAQEKKDVDRKIDKRTDRVSDEISDGTRDAVPPTIEESDRGRTARGTDDARRTDRRKRAQSSALKAGYTQEQLDQFNNIGYEPFESTDEKGNKTIGFRKIEETKVPEVPKTKPIAVTTPEVKTTTEDKPITQTYNPKTGEVKSIIPQETEVLTEPKVTVSTIEDQINQYINKRKAGVNLNQLANQLKISPSNASALFNAAAESGNFDTVIENGIRVLKPKAQNTAKSAHDATSDKQLKDLLNSIDINEVNALETISQIVKNPNSSASTRTKAAEIYNKAYKVAKPKIKQQVETPDEINQQSFLDEFKEIAEEVEKEFYEREANKYFNDNEDELFSTNEQIPADKDVLRATKNATNIVQALQILKEQFSHRLSKPSLFLIDKLLSIPSLKTTSYRIEYIEKPSFLSDDPKGAYSPSNNSIRISPTLGTIQTILHEAVHAATANAIKTNSTLKEKVKTLMVAAKLADPNKQFRIKDEDEFIAEAFTDPNYQRFLSVIKTPKPTNVIKSIWNDFVNLVKSVIKAPSLSNTIMNDVISLADDLFQGPGKDIFGRTDPANANDSLFASRIQSPSELKAQADALVEGSNTKIVPNDPNQPFVSTADELKLKAKETTGKKRILDEFETEFVSNDAALNNAIRRELRNNKDWQTYRKILTEISQSQVVHWDAVGHQYLQDGDIVYDQEAYKFKTQEGQSSWHKIMKSLKSIAEAKGITFEEMEQYAHTYLVAFRESQIKNNNEKLKDTVRAFLRAGQEAEANKAWNSRKTGWKLNRLSSREIQQGLDIENIIPEVKDIQQQWDYVRKNIINFLHESGLYSLSEAETLIDTFGYVPFYRAEQIAAGAGPQEYSRGLLTIGDKLFKGSKKPVNNVFDNMERWITYSIGRGIKNKSAIVLKNAAIETLGSDRVRKLGYKETGPKENVVTIHENVIVNGEEKQMANRYLFQDPLFIKAFTGMESFAIPQLKLMAAAARGVRNSIILQPIFTATQITSDAFSAMGYVGAKRAPLLLLDVATELLRTVTKTSTVRETLKKYGAVGGSNYMSISAREDAAIKAGIKNKDWRALALRPFRALTTISDNIIRQAIYKRILKETGDKAKAIEAAFEIINFRRSGANAALNTAKQYTPFLGAYIQAMNVMYKVATLRGITPESRMKNLATLSGALVSAWVLNALYTSLNAGDEDYEETDPSIRDRRLLIPGTGISLPLRTDLFTLFGKALPEHLINYYIRNTEDSTKIKKALRDYAINAISGPLPIPQGIKAPIMLLANYDPLTGRPVVGQSMEELEPELQRTERTTQLGKLAGDKFGISPIQFDYFWNNMTGSLYQMFNIFANPLIADLRGDVLPEQDWRTWTRENIPSARSFVLETIPTSRLKNDFYELRDITSQLYASYKSYKGDKSPKAAEYRKEHQKLIRLNKALDNTSRYLSLLRNQRKYILDSKKGYTPEQKKRMIDAINAKERAVLNNAIRRLDYRRMGEL